MEACADHLFGVVGVEAGQRAPSSRYLFTVHLGLCEGLRGVLHQLVTPAIPWDPTIGTRGLLIYKRFCMNTGRQTELLWLSQVNLHQSCLYSSLSQIDT